LNLVLPRPSPLDKFWILGKKIEFYHKKATPRLGQVLVNPPFLFCKKRKKKFEQKNFWNPALISNALSFRVQVEVLVFRKEERKAKSKKTNKLKKIIGEKKTNIFSFSVTSVEEGLLMGFWADSIFGLFRTSFYFVSSRLKPLTG